MEPRSTMSATFIQYTKFPPQARCEYTPSLRRSSTGGRSPRSSMLLRSLNLAIAYKTAAICRDQSTLHVSPPPLVLLLKSTRMMNSENTNSLIKIMQCVHFVNSSGARIHILDNILSRKIPNHLYERPNFLLQTSIPRDTNPVSHHLRY